MAKKPKTVQVGSREYFESLLVYCTTTQLVVYLVPKQLPVILARVLRYKAPPCLAVFQGKTTKQIDIVGVPL